MGTDINGFAEWKWNDAESRFGAWTLIAPVPDIRSYRVFELLADVRSSGDIDNRFTDAIPLRGVPDEYIDKQSVHGFDMGDHSFTWYTLEEINRPEMWAQIEHELPRETWLAFIAYLKWHQKCWWNSTLRIVIGFDS